MMYNPMTEAIYAFIECYIKEQGIPPSQREIAEGCYLVRSAVIRHLDRLEAYGRITRIHNTSRGIRLTKK